MDEREEQGGVVTTVKEETTKDQDVLARLAEENANNEPPAEEKTATPKAEAKKDAPKPKAEAKSVQPNLDDDEDYVPLDFNALTPEQQRAVRRVYQQRRKASQRAELLEDQLRETQEQLRSGKREELKEDAKPKVDLSALGERPKPPNPKDPKYTSLPPDQGQALYDKDYEEYEDKRDEHNYNRRRAEEKAKEQQDTQLREARTAFEAYTEQADTFAEAHPDYHELTDNLPMNDVMYGFVIRNGPEVLYQLAQTPKEAERIRRLGNVDQAVESLLRIKFRLEFEKEAAEKEQAGADKNKGKGNPPPKDKPEVPPAPVGGRAAPPVQKDRSKMTFKERERERFRQNPGQFNYEP